MLEIRTFGENPSSLHVVSLALHLCNCLLVGRLAISLAPNAGSLLPYLSMLLYALHPALIEPIAWISAQSELAVTLFILLGLYANLAIGQSSMRALCVSGCFLAAACCKESAVAFPLAIVLCDWTRPISDNGKLNRFGRLLRKRWQSYVGMLLAGLLYLWMRQAQLGYVLEEHSMHPLPLLVRVQEACYVYLTYLRLMIWPMVGLAPEHLINENSFSTMSFSSLLIDVGALSIFAYAVIGGWRGTAGGKLVAGATLLMLPMLHIIPVKFDESLYHDRYIMAPLGLALAFLPGVLSVIATRIQRAPLMLAAATTIWLAFALINIVITLPLWADNVSLWAWALRADPSSLSARENLFAAFVMGHDPHASDFARQLTTDPLLCPVCLINVAYFAEGEGDTGLAGIALSRLEQSGVLPGDMRLLASEQAVAARVLEKQGDLPGAEAAYHTAIAATPQDPQAHMQLALLLAREGKDADARRAADVAFALFPPNLRDEQRSELEKILKQGPRSSP